MKAIVLTIVVLFVAKGYGQMPVTDAVNAKINTEIFLTLQQLTATSNSSKLKIAEQLSTMRDELNTARAIESDIKQGREALKKVSQTVKTSRNLEKIFETEQTILYNVREFYKTLKGVKLQPDAKRRAEDYVDFILDDLTSYINTATDVVSDDVLEGTTSERMNILYQVEQAMTKLSGDLVDIIARLQLIKIRQDRVPGKKEPYEKIERNKY